MFVFVSVCGCVCLCVQVLQCTVGDGGVGVIESVDEVWDMRYLIAHNKWFLLNYFLHAFGTLSNTLANKVHTCAQYTHPVCTVHVCAPLCVCAADCHVSVRVCCVCCRCVTCICTTLWFPLSLHPCALHTVRVLFPAPPLRAPQHASRSSAHTLALRALRVHLLTCN